MADEVLAEIKDTLDSLVSNDKAPITVLSMLAEENMQYAPGIASAIEERIKTAPANLKLPALYLVDSIIKNHKSPDYLNLFAKNIISVFVSAFEKVDEKTRMAMYKLRQTWPKFFPNDTLLALDLAIKNIDPAWPVTAKVNKTVEFQTESQQTPQVHLNPDFFSKAKEALKGLTTNSSKGKAVQPTIVERVGVTSVLSHHAASVSTLIPALSPSLVSSPLADGDPEMLLSKQIMAKQLLAKQQELLQIQQRRLEIELAKAQLQIEMQAKQLAEHKLAGELKKQQLVPLLSPKDKPAKKSPKGKKARKLSKGEEETAVGVAAAEVTEAPDSSKKFVEVPVSEVMKTSSNITSSEAILVATSKASPASTTQNCAALEAVAISPSKLQGKKRKSSDVVKIDPRLKKKMLLGPSNFQAIEDKPASVGTKLVEVHSNHEDSKKELKVAKVAPEVSTKKIEAESKLPEDLKDLFGSEDKDFRMKPPPMPPSSLVEPSQSTTQWKTLSSPPEFGIDRAKKLGNQNRVHPYVRQISMSFNKKALLPTPSGARGGRQVKENYEKLREIKGELDKEMERLNGLCYDPNANDDFEAFEADVKRNNSLLNKARWNGRRQQQERGRRQLRAQQRSSFLPPPPRIIDYHGRPARPTQFTHKQSPSSQFYQQSDQSNYNHEPNNFYNNENEGYSYNDQYNDDPRCNDYSNNSSADNNRYDYYNEKSRSPVQWGGRGGYRKGSRRGTPPSNRQGQSPPFQGESFSNSSFPHHLPNFNSTKASLPLTLQNLFSGFKVEPQNQQQQASTTTVPATTASALPEVDIHQLFSKLTQFGILSKATTVKEETDEKKIKRLETPILSDFDTKKMAIKYASSIDYLYSGNSCKTCGLQFCQRYADKDRGEEATKWRYMMHLDWHFKGNETEDMASSADKHRMFYKDLSDWYKFDEENHVAADLPKKDEDTSEAETTDIKPGIALRPLVIVKPKPTGPLEVKLEEMKEKYKDELKENPLLVEMKDGGEVCFMCHDGFDTFWDDERNEMCLKGALLLTDKWFHPVCFTDFKGHEFYTRGDYPTGDSEYRTSQSSSTPSSAAPEDGNIVFKTDVTNAVTRDDDILGSQSNVSITAIEMTSDDSEQTDEHSTTERDQVGESLTLHPIKREVITE